jgi:predicted transcriptional regulator
MRTTFTIEDDIVVELKHLRRGRDRTLKDIINEALRRGLREMRAHPKRKPFRTAGHDMGKFLVNVDNVAEAIEHAERENFK